MTENAVEQAVSKVLSKAGTVLFAGLREDAEKFVEDHFPRQHIDVAGNSEPDYTLVHPEPAVTEPEGAPAEPPTA